MSEADDVVALLDADVVVALLDSVPLALVAVLSDATEVSTGPVEPVPSDELSWSLPGELAAHARASGRANKGDRGA